MPVYQPEGMIMDSAENKQYFCSFASLERAKLSGKILESRAIVCDRNHNLIVDMGTWRGIIPREQGALGIDDGSTRDIAVISRVNKPVCYKITDFYTDSRGVVIPHLSRRQAQQECLEQYIMKLRGGDVVDAVVTHLDAFGCFVDLGCGIPSLIPIDAISVSRISHPRDRFSPRQHIKAVVRSVTDTGRATLSHKELLGTWEENAALFNSGETVIGIIRSVESYGVFVELTPNLAGLAEPREGVRVGQYASVYIKSMIPEKMKVKLIIVDAFDDGSEQKRPLDYFITQGRILKWQYSPSQCQRLIETDFERQP